MAIKTKKRSNRGLISWFSALSRAKKLAVVFVIIFAAVGGYMLYKSYAAVGDELQAKDNAKWGVAIAKKIRMAPDGSYGYTLDGYGGIHPFHTFGAQPASPTQVTGYWNGWDIARDIVFTKMDPVAPKGYVLDGFGGIHPFGGATAVKGNAYWNGWDIARKIVIVKTVNGSGGYTLDGFGGLHPFAIGSATPPPALKQGPNFNGQDYARDVIVRSDGAVGEILDCHGGISPVGFGTNNAPAYVNGFPYDTKRCDYKSFAFSEWTKPSGVVISNTNFAGFGTMGVAPFVNSGLGPIVDATSKVVNGVRRYWALDEKGGIRAYSEPNKPIWTDQELLYFAMLEYNNCTTQTLRQGSTGRCVQILQDKLNFLVGKGLAVDGNFGAATDLVVRAYQCGNGLAGTGVLDSGTWAAITAGKRGFGTCAQRVECTDTTAPTHALYHGGLTYSDWEAVPGNYESIDLPFTIYNDPGKQSNMYLSLYGGYMANSRGYDSGFYLGIQTPGKAIFSKFGITDLNDVSVGPGGEIHYGTNEGPYVQTIHTGLSFPPGNYSAHLYRRPAQAYALYDWFDMYLQRPGEAWPGLKVGGIRFFRNSANVPVSIPNKGGAFTEFYDLAWLQVPYWHVGLQRPVLNGNVRPYQLHTQYNKNYPDSDSQYIYGQGVNDIYVGDAVSRCHGETVYGL